MSRSMYTDNNPPFENSGWGSFYSNLYDIPINGCSNLFLEFNLSPAVPIYPMILTYVGEEYYLPDAQIDYYKSFYGCL